MNEKQYYITGMHCASCELLIEKRILKEKGVHVADASLGNGTLRIECDGRMPLANELNTWFQSDGYTFSDTKPTQKREPLLYVQEGKGIQIDKRRLKRMLGGLTKVALVFLVLALIQQTGIASYVSVTDSSSLGVFFVFGLVAGLSSCAALIGGILLSMTKNWNEQSGYEASAFTKMRPHFFFHGGRLFAYALLGGVLGAVGKAVAFENVTVYAFITILVSVVMLLIGLQMAGVSWAQRFQLRMPKIITRRIAKGNGQSGSQLPFAVGAGTVLLPCGFTLIAQGIALTSGSALRGALMLSLFVLGTMIPLLFIGVASVQGTKNPNRSRAFSFYAGVILVIFASYNVNGQFNVLGFPSVSDVFARPDTAAPIASSVVNTDGEQVVSMGAKGFKYTLTSAATIQAGVPTKLVVDDQGIQGCGIFLSARGLINGFTELKLGQNIIDLGSPAKGTYKITCSMGMVPPVTLRVE